MSFTGGQGSKPPFPCHCLNMAGCFHNSRGPPRIETKLQSPTGHSAAYTYTEEKGEKGFFYLNTALAGVPAVKPFPPRRWRPQPSPEAASLVPPAEGAQCRSITAASPQEHPFKAVGLPTPGTKTPPSSSRSHLQPARWGKQLRQRHIFNLLINLLFLNLKSLIHLPCFAGPESDKLFQELLFPRSR